MLNLPRILAKGLIYSFHVSSPSYQDLILLLNPSLLPASLEAPTRPASPSSLADPSVLAQDHASPLLLGKTRWSHVWRRHIRHNQTVRQAVEYCTCISVVWRDDRWNKERYTGE